MDEIQEAGFGLLESGSVCRQIQIGYACSGRMPPEPTAKRKRNWTPTTFSVRKSCRGELESLTSGGCPILLFYLAPFNSTLLYTANYAAFQMDQACLFYES
jgi:hypothetical protein